MKIFEFSFNAKKRKDRFFEVFFYEPKSPKKKPKGSLYVVGELKNALEFNATFLKQLSETIQKEYYSSSLKGATLALKAALKAANHFLAQESKKGNVDWLGNLNLAVLLFITVQEKKTMFHLAKTGTIKVSLVRHGMAVNIGKNLEASSKQPGKVFGNLVSGTLMPNDSVTAATQEIFDVVSKEKSLEEIGNLREAKEFRAFFLKHERMISRSCGVLISFIIEEEIAKRSLINKSLFSFFPKPRMILPKMKLELPWIRCPPALRKHVVLLLLLFCVLLVGSLLF